MTRTIPSTGYIVGDNEGVIYGYAPTLDAAWTNAETYFRNASIALLDDDADSTEQLGSWCRRSDLIARPASAALIANVEDGGATDGWWMRNGVACTRAESEDEDA
jgi:hypothetical protein